MLENKILFAFITNIRYQNGKPVMWNEIFYLIAETLKFNIQIINLSQICITLDRNTVAGILHAIKIAIAGNDEVQV